MHIDMPTRDDIERLAAARNPVSVTVYVPTSPLRSENEHDMLRARALFDEAMEIVRERAVKQDADLIQEQLYGLLEDTEFWWDLGQSLAIFVTPTSSMELRLPNQLEPQVNVSDRFAISSLLRATTFPQAAFVLAASQNENRLVEVSADGPAEQIEVPDAPDAARSPEGEGPTDPRSPHGRLRGDEGQKVRLAQYARSIDRALRPVLAGESLPLILAATEPTLAAFRNDISYAHVAQQAILGNPEDLTDQELADSAREILDEIYVQELKDLQETFIERGKVGRAATDMSDLARAAAYGAIDTLMVDMNARVSGSVDEAGRLELGTERDALEEIVRMTVLSGGRVLSLRSDDMPGQVEAAAILRYAI